jgi:hypothetical protein
MATLIAFLQRVKRKVSVTWTCGCLLVYVAGIEFNLIYLPADKSV